MRHLLFNEAEAASFIARHFTSREVAAFQACAVPAMQADYFRYCAILALGGVYVDVDFLCERPLRELTDTVDGGLLVRVPPGRVVQNNFFVFSSPGHAFLRLALDVATVNIEQRIAQSVNFVTGPLVFTCLAELHRAGSLDVARNWSPEQRVNRLTESVFATAGSFERINTAFEGVRIEAPPMAGEWVATPVSKLKYKHSAVRWSSWPSAKGSIFR